MSYFPGRVIPSSRNNTPSDGKVLVLNKNRKVASSTMTHLLMTMSKEQGFE